MRDMEKVLKDYISDVWKEIDFEYGENYSKVESEPTVWMSILSIMQNKADAFDIDRRYLGIPVEDADTLYVKMISRKI